MELPHIVWVDCPDFNVVDCLAHPHRIEGNCLVVRLDLPDDHTAFQDYYGDNGDDAPMPEFISYVPFASVRLQDGSPFRPDNSTNVRLGGSR